MNNKNVKKNHFEDNKIYHCIDAVYYKFKIRKEKRLSEHCSLSSLNMLLLHKYVWSQFNMFETYNRLFVNQFQLVVNKLSDRPYLWCGQINILTIIEQIPFNSDWIVRKIKKTKLRLEI